MGDIYVYRPTEDNFSTIGLCGSLEPISCEFEEIANGLSEITMEHPLDHNGKWKWLRNDYILSVEVPVRTTPEIYNGAYVTSVEQCVVSANATKNDRYVMSKETGGKKLTLIPSGTSVTVLKRSQNADMVRVRTGRASGWMQANALTYSSSTVIPASESGIESVAPAWDTRTQLFRIYSVELRDGESAVKVQAKHITYDLMLNITTYADESEHTLKDTIDGIMGNCIASHGFSCSTVITDVHGGNSYCDSDPISAILEPDTGVCAVWNAQLVRDNYEMYLLKIGGVNRGVVIEYGSNITGVSMQTDMSSVATRIRPIGTGDGGAKLYLTGAQYPDGCIDSDLRSSYAFDRIVTMTVSEARVSKDMSAAAAIDVMINAVKEQYDSGADKPKVSVSVKFALIGSDDRYAQYRNLEGVYLFDTVRVYYPPLGIDVSTTVVRCRFDCISGRMISVELGDLMSLTPTVQSWQIGSINGTKIIAGTISSGSYTQESVTTRQILDGAVTEDKIADSAVTESKVADGSITYDKLSLSLRQLLHI